MFRYTVPQALVDSVVEPVRCIVYPLQIVVTTIVAAGLFIGGGFLYKSLGGRQGEPFLDWDFAVFGLIFLLTTCVLMKLVWNLVLYGSARLFCIVCEEMERSRKDYEQASRMV